MTLTGSIGDMDGSETVTMLDALLALRVAGGLVSAADPGVQFQSGNVYPAGAPDNIITLGDAIRILRFVAGIEMLP